MKAREIKIVVLMCILTTAYITATAGKETYQIEGLDNKYLAIFLIIVIINLITFNLCVMLMLFVKGLAGR
jgi:hypothetical protein